MNGESRIYVAGHRGLVGSALWRRLEAEGCRNLIGRTHAELDLTDRGAVFRFFERERPEYVFLAAAKVGGILANNSYPADFIRENLEIGSNVIQACHGAQVRRLIFFGSSSMYPRLCPQPMREEYLMSGPLEPTNRPYALGKLAGLEMCWAYNRQYGTRYLAVMPSNLYGPGDNFAPGSSHVLPSLIRKAHEAKQQGAARMTVWGSGQPRREFLYSEDLADATLLLMRLEQGRFDTLLHAETAPLVNIGVGEDVTIRELAEMVAREVGFEGELVFDASRPDGTPRKLLDVSRMRGLGWEAKTTLEVGIRLAYQSFLDKQGDAD